MALTSIDLNTLHRGLPDISCYYVASIGSTQSEVKTNSLLVTDHQTAGVGRRGNDWLTPAGRSICLSYRFDSPLPMAQMSGFSMVTALAVLATLETYQADIDVQLKWPNDLFHQGAKFAGILISLLPPSHKNKSHEVIVGIGINWQLTPTQLNYINQNTCNLPLNRLPDRSEFIVQLIKQINCHHETFVQQGLEPHMPKWEQHDLFKDQMVQITNETNPTIGKYIGINHQGELLLQTKDGIKTFCSGEVSVKAL